MRLKRLSSSGLVLGFLIALNVAPVTPSFADSYSYYSLSEASGETFKVGDVLQIQSEFCWSSKKPDPRYPSRIEIYEAGKWKSVGSASFRKDKSVCSKAKYPYLRVFTWTANQVGNFQLRNREKSPSVNALITVTAKTNSSTNSGNGSGSTSGGGTGSSGGSTSGGGSTSFSGIDKATCSFKGQKLYGRVFITDREIFSDFTVYITDREIFSDLTVFKSDREIFANRCGLWYITDREIFSDFTIYLTDREIFAGVRR